MKYAMSGAAEPDDPVDALDDEPPEVLAFDLDELDPHPAAANPTVAARAATSGRFIFMVCDPPLDL
ncbi:MAG TPA: hypothetical protein VFP54_10455 [Acidimicrobiales bacterium]|nr:hypothetical protein [Acidimicrobiales bacterium]